MAKTKRTLFFVLVWMSGKFDVLVIPASLRPFCLALLAPREKAPIQRLSLSRQTRREKQLLRRRRRGVYSNEDPFLFCNILLYSSFISAKFIRRHRNTCVGRVVCTSK